MDLLAIHSMYGASLLAALLFISGMFVVGRRMGRFDIVDVAWGLVFIAITATSLLLAETVTYVQLLVCALVSIWGFRLSSHIYRRLRATSSEDKRYVEMRRKWRSGNENVAIYVRIYVVQAVLASIVCLPVIILNASNAEAGLPFVISGLLIWLTGFSVEATADRQLRRFIADPQHKGQLMTGGLWRYSRHPNYFGELLLWWGVGVIALGVPFGWIGLIGPLVINYLIIFVSGIPPTETAFAGRAGWADYRRRTNMLVPWFTKK